jgi:hypothetical protein
MRKEEEEKLEAPGSETGFYSLPRRVFPPAGPPHPDRGGEGDGKDVKASKERWDHSGAHWSLSVRDLQSSSSACTSDSVSARRFASWTALTPLRVGKKTQSVWSNTPASLH